MTNKNFIDALSVKLGKTKKETREIVEAFEVVLKETVSSDSFKNDNKNKIKVADITFSVKDTASRSGFNPKTKEKIVIPASKKLSVKVSNDFKSLVKN